MYGVGVVDSFMRRASNHFSIDIDQLKDPNRHKREVEVKRFVYIAFITFTNIKPSQFSDLFGQERTTVIHAIQTHKDILSTKGNGDYILRFNAWMEAMSSYIENRKPQFKMIKKR